MSEQYFPSLSSLIKIDDLPEQLNFLQTGVNGLAEVFDKVYYQNLEINHANSGAVSSYQLDLVSLNKLAWDIPGTGLTLAFDTNFEANDNISIIPVGFTFNLPIKKYIKGKISLSNIDFSLKYLLDLAAAVSGISNEALIRNTAYSFLTTTNPVRTFADSLISNHSFLLKASLTDENEIIADILSYSKAISSVDLKQIVFQDYILNSTYGNPEDNLNKLLFSIIGKNPIGSIKDLFIPKISARLVLNNAGLLIPRTVLIPLDENGNQVAAPARTALNFGQFELNYSTEGGIGFDSEVSFTLNPEWSAIGNTGLAIKLLNVKLDLSRTSNIAEADADGRPSDFMGVYAQDATIKLPASWLPASGSTAAIKARNLLIGTGGISGLLSLESINPNTQNPVVNFTLGGFTLSISAFALNFHQNSITQCAINGTLKLHNSHNGCYR